MSRRRLAVAAAIGIAAVVAAIAALPWFADTAAVRRALERQLSTAIDGEVRYDSFSLDYFPPLTARLSGVDIRIPGTAQGRIAALRVRVALLPLLLGDVRPRSIQIEQPEFEDRIAPGGAADPFTAYRAAVGPLVDALASRARALSFTMDDGKLDLVHADGRRLTLSKLDASAAVSDATIEAAASASAEWWRGAQARVTITPGSLAVTAKLQLDGLRGTALIGALFPAAGVQVRAPSLDATIDAIIDAATDVRPTVRAALKASAPQIALARGANAAELGALSVALEVERDPASLSVSLSQFALGSLLPAASGHLRARGDGASPALELEVPALDVAQVRAAALALAADVDGVRAAFSVINAGTLRSLRIRGAAADFASLADVRALQADAAVEAAALTPPAAGVAIGNGTGRLVLAEGRLQGHDLAGEVGKSSFSGGSLAMQIVPTVALHDATAALDADLAETLAITRRLIGPRGVPALAAIDAVEGRASGKVAYAVHGGKARLSVDVSRLRASGRYRGVPFPIEISQGMLSYGGDRLSIRSLAGSVGRSRLQQGGAEITLGTRPTLRNGSGVAMLAADELHPWLASLEGLRPALAQVKDVTGGADVRITHLSGPLTTPAALEFEATVQPRALRATLAALSSPLLLESGTLHLTPRVLRLEQVAASLLDARVVASGRIEDYAVPERHAILDVPHTALGPQAIAWIDQRWRIPPAVMPKAPMTLADVRVEWRGGANQSQRAQGKATLAGGARAEFDLGWQGDSLDLRRLAVEDEDSNFELQLKLAPARAAELGFKGRLDHRTLQRSLSQAPVASVLAEGDLRAAIDVREPLRSTARGALAVERLDLLPLIGVPLAIERVQLDADGQRLQVRDGAVRLAGEPIAISGSVARSAQRFIVDARVSADELDAARLLDALARKRTPGRTGPVAAWNLPLEGRVALAAGAIAYSGYALQRVAGTVSLAPNRIAADLTEAQLCGISVPATIVFTPGNVALATRPAARSIALAPTLACLTEDRVAATGTFDLDAHLSASGPADALLESLRGDFRFSARAGRIDRDVALSRTLAVDEVASRLGATREAVRDRGLEYEHISLAGTLVGTVLHLEHGLLESPTLGFTASGDIELRRQTLALQGLVAPLDTFNRAARRVPLVGRVFGTSLVVIPLSIHGEWRDPQVRVLPAAAIGASLRNLMSATFRAPIELLDPLVGRGQQAP